MNPSPAIQFDRVWRRFPEGDALRGLTWSVPEGSITALLGRNGAGKTTALKCLMGLLRPDSGEMRIFGEPMIFGQDGRRASSRTLARVGYVSEVTGLDPRLTVDQLIRLTRPLYPRWDDALTSDLMERLQLDPTRRVGTLSLGQSRKVSLLLNLAFRPELLILDEPAANLDAVVRREFLAAVLELFRDDGLTVVLSTHQLSDVERFADRIALIEAGALRVDATQDDLKDRVKALRFGRDRFPEGPPALEGELRRRLVGEDVEVTVENYREGSSPAWDRSEDADVAVVDLPLEDIFIAYGSGQNGVAAAPGSATPGGVR